LPISSMARGKNTYCKNFTTPGGNRPYRQPCCFRAPCPRLPSNKSCLIRGRLRRTATRGFLQTCPKSTSRKWHSRGRRFDPAWLHHCRRSLVVVERPARPPIAPDAVGSDARLVAPAIGPAVISVVTGTIIATARASIRAAPTADRLNGRVALGDRRQISQAPHWRCFGLHKG
jgi:hypothetical protein